MPRLSWSQTALLDLARLHDFLAPKNRSAATRAVKAIRQGVKVLAANPEIGRQVYGLPPEVREWVIEFGRGAYVARYAYQGKHLVILAVCHGREAN